MSITYLKVKIKSLAVEASIIRHEERKWLKSGRWLRKQEPHPSSKHSLELNTALNTWAGLSTHRLDLRIEQRAALVAYGFLRSVPYRSIEREPHWLKKPYSKPGPNWNRVNDLVWKYGPFHPAGDKKETERGKKKLWDMINQWHDHPGAIDNAVRAVEAAA